MLDVMIIDDDIAVRERLKAMIQWDSMQLHLSCEAADSDTAMELYLTHRPRIIITDICIPVISGLELAEQLLQTDPLIRFIVVTGYNDFEYVQKSVRLGAVDLLAKPIFKEDIDRSLRRAICFFDQQRESFSEFMRQNVDDLRILQRAFVRDILDGRVREKRTIEKKLQSLNLRLSARYYSVAAIEALWTDGRAHPEKAEGLLEPIQMQLSENRIAAYCCLDKSGAICCLLNTDAQETDNRIEELLSRLQDSLQLMVGCSLFIGIGRTVEGLEQVPQSRVEAMISLNYQQIQSDSSIVHYKNIRRFETPQLDENAFLSYLMDQFRANNLDELIVSIENHVYGLLLQSTHGQNLVRNFCAEYLLEAIKTSLLLGMPVKRLNECEISLSELNRREDPTWQLSYVLGATKRLCSGLFHTKNDSANYLVSQAKEYIGAHLQNPDLNLDNISEAIGLSRIYFCKLFHREEGVCFTDYLKSARIERAKQMLVQTNSKVFEISDAVGFSNAKYFGYVFKREVGMTPLEYQKTVFSKSGCV